MRVFGLTGGIASGKSTVTRMFRELGATVLDADELAREVVAKGSPGLALVEARFPGVIQPNGELDRSRLGARIFSNPEERQALNAIVHPLIQALFAKKKQALAAQGLPCCLYDAALLFENGLEKSLDGTLLVQVPPEIQRQRLMQRDGLSAEEAEARISAQMPLAEKARKATWVVDNSGSLESTRQAVQALWKTLQSL